MSDTEIKLSIYSPDRSLVGFIRNFQVENYENVELKITGQFIDSENQTPNKIEFNPQVLPYSVDISELKIENYSNLVNVYIHRGIQPIVISGLIEK